MGAGDGMSQGAKTSKPQQHEQQQSTNSFSEWAAAFQAYYGSGAQPPPHAPGYYAPAASGPQAHHPYIWGGQMMPYGAPPPPYPTMYPAGAMYHHPSIPPSTHPYGQFSTGTISTPTSPGTTDGPTVRGKVPPSSNGDAKTAERNGSGYPSGNPVKRCKSNAALVPAASAGDTAKPGQNSGDGMSNSGDSGGSDDTSDSEDEPGQNGSLAYRKRAYDQNSAEASASVPGHGSTRSGTIAPAGNGGPTTTLGVSIDYWQNSTATSTPITSTSTKSAMASKKAVTTEAVVPIPPPPPPLPPPAPSSMTSLVPATTPRDGIQDLWYQDEREFKRQRRKQSNRESARRSRLRKQAECEELGARVETLTNENMTLRTELTRLYDECKKLAADNASLKDELRYLRDGRSRGENGKGELQQLQQQQATRANASGEMWKKSLHLRKESTMSETANGGVAMASSADRVADVPIVRGGSVDGAGVASSSPGAGGMDRGGNRRRGSRSPSRNGSNHHHNGSGSGSRRSGGQGSASAGKSYDEDGDGYNDRSGKSPTRRSTLGLNFGTGRETVAAG